MRFCTTCENRLDRIIEGGKLSFKCSGCPQTYDINDETTIFNDFLGTHESILKYETFIRNGAFDKTNPIVREICPNKDCDISKNIIRMIRVGEEERVIFCCQCGKTWTKI